MKAHTYTYFLCARHSVSLQHMLTFLPYKVAAINVLILQMKKVRHREL